MDKTQTKILIVEDSLTQAVELKYVLEENGFLVTHAINGEKAIENLNEFIPDIIICDIVMPGMDGYQFSSLVKANEQLKTIPIILLTSLSDPQDVMRGLEHGADSFLVKPFDEDLLIERIHYFIENTAHRKLNPDGKELEILFNKEKFHIQSSPRQILDILLATYQNSLYINKQLLESNKSLKLAQDKLSRMNRLLEEKVSIRTKELKSINEELIEKEKHLKELNATKDKFFSIISHDLKNPFNSIIGLSDLLIEQIHEKDYNGIIEFASTIQDTALHTMTLLINLLEWANSQTGKLKYQPEQLNIESLINEVFALVKSSANEKTIRVSTEIPSNCMAFADKAMISTIIRNLVSNAIKFTNPQGEINISVVQSEDELIVTIADDGVGIDRKKIKDLFRIDKNASTQGTNNEKGTGLGLHLCKEFVEKHGGRIWVESEPGIGTSFHFSIPNVEREN